MVALGVGVVETPLVVTNKNMISAVCLIGRN